MMRLVFIEQYGVPLSYKTQICYFPIPKHDTSA